MLEEKKAGVRCRAAAELGGVHLILSVHAAALSDQNCLSRHGATCRDMQANEG